MAVLVLGGAGFIGSNLCKMLLSDESEVISVDCEKSLYGKSYVLDIANYEALKEVFLSEDIYEIYYLANTRSNDILDAYQNVSKIINVLRLAKEFEVSKIIFNSSFLVYGNPYSIPVTEDEVLSPNTPFGKALAIIEGILKDLYRTNHNFNIGILRYGITLGVNCGLDNPFLKNVIDAMNQELEYLDLALSKSKDQTQEFDYIHVYDVARANISMSQYLEKNHGLSIFNIGYGIPISLGEFIKTMEIASNREIPYRLVKTDLDVNSFYLDTKKMDDELNFYPQRTLEDICQDLVKTYKK